MKLKQGAEYFRDEAQFCVDSIVPDLSAHSLQVVSCRYHRGLLGYWSDC